MGERIANTIEFKVDINLINSTGNYLPHASEHQTNFLPHVCLTINKIRCQIEMRCGKLPQSYSIQMLIYSKTKKKLYKFPLYNFEFNKNREMKWIKCILIAVGESIFERLLIPSNK